MLCSMVTDVETSLRTKCDADYIGKTKRILVHRLKEHDKGETSACKRHLHEHPGHHMDFQNVQIIDQASNDMKLKIKELSDQR